MFIDPSRPPLLLNSTLQLEREYARIMPALKALVEKEKVRQQKDDRNRNLGFSQAFEYGKRSSEEYVSVPRVF